MSYESILSDLKNDWKEQVGLTAEELAKFLRKKTTRGGIQEVRARMKSGHYPGAKIIDGKLILPLDALAKILDDAPAAAPTPAPGIVITTIAPSKPSTRRRSEIGPRLGFIRNAQFWEKVFNIMGYSDEANELHKEIEEKIRFGKNEWQAKKAALSKASLMAALANNNSQPAPDDKIM